MSALGCKELYLLLECGGSLVAFQEQEASWAGVLGFSSEELAREFCGAGGLEQCQIAAIDTTDHASVAALIRQIKRRTIRYLFLDLDYSRGNCLQVELEGDAFGPARERQFTPHRH